ncbi:MAG: glycosyl hydrolase family 18 protein [Bacteroidales bacterium]
MKIKVLLPILILALMSSVFSQEIDFKSIHQEQSEFYRNFIISQKDSIFQTKVIRGTVKYQLAKRVFGYDPYWSGNDYVNYQWDLLSDLCHFSYEVNPATGDPVTTHNWDSSPAIDSALAYNVKVHLCITLFSGHYTFFQNPEAQQNLINTIITMIQNRGAHGVNMDIEALPSSLGSEFTDFIKDLSGQMELIIPEAELSIASPAVNWNGTFNIPVLAEYIDFFMVMGYDYYWNSSSQAGPVSPLYSMTANYDYNFSKTISYYQSQGVHPEKLIMGVPYYGRQWPTQGQYAPSSVSGSGTAYTYRYVQINSSIYTNENKHWEPNSYAPYFAFYNNNGWYQCFMDDTYSLAKKYDQINRRNIAGIGIWALGYDNGFTELWELIADKFTKTAIPVAADTIFDTGGPSFNYYENEDYTYTISSPENTTIYLSFSYLNLEEVYDSIWIFDGTDTLSPLIGGYSGSNVPTLISSSSNSITLKFNSDNGISDAGWRAVYDTIPVSAVEEHVLENHLSIYPNPATNDVTIFFPDRNCEGQAKIRILDSKGILVNDYAIICNQDNLTFQINGQSRGVYFVLFEMNGKILGKQKLIIN